jgi:hypothetical protein
VQDAVDVQENRGHGRRVYSVGDRVPLLAVERAGRPARPEELEQSTGLTAAERRRVLEKLGPVVRAVAQDERSQLRNRELATERILEQLRDAVRVRRRRRPTKPTAASREQRLEGKRRRGRTKRLRRDVDE